MIDECNSRATALAERWTLLLERREFHRARTAAQRVVAHCRSVLRRDYIDGRPEGLSETLIFGILFHGFLNHLELETLASRQSWLQHTKDVEDGWCILCDAQDRLTYVAPAVNLDAVPLVLERLDELERSISSNYGSGLFMSPEALWKGMNCSICEIDYRICEHHAGGIYNGVRCTVSPREIVGVRAVSLVDTPQDRRCRIWPWHYSREENGYVKFAKVPIMTAFRVDEFLDSDDL